MLYPLKFKPRFKERVWGGGSLRSRMNKKPPAGKPIGESWELSSVPGDISVAANGPLAGNNLEELVEVYMGDLVGDRVYNRFGLLFPLLIKLIDAGEALSVQVHPDDKLARERHNSPGKTEMWYVLDCAPGAELSVGFNRPVSREEYLRHVEAGTLPSILKQVKVKPGDAYFIPAGVIHAIGKGILIAEIQQTSDITYRVFDWNRADARELHTDLAVDAITFGAAADHNITRSPIPGTAVPLVESPFFTTNIVEVNAPLTRSHIDKDSFVIYMVIGGDMTLRWAGGEEKAAAGETILLPAILDEVTFDGCGKLLEVYM